MPNARELTRMLNDVQQLVPAIVGAIVAIATAIGVLVPSLEDGSSSNALGGNGGTSNSRPTDSKGGFSKPETSSSNYLVDQEKFDPRELKSNVSVTVNGKDYAKSLISTDNKARSSYQQFIVPAGYESLNFTAAWSDTVPNSGGVGIVTVTLDGGERGKVYIKQGQKKSQKIDVRGGGRVKISVDAVNNLDEKKDAAANGLALLSPVLK